MTTFSPADEAGRTGLRRALAAAVAAALLWLARRAESRGEALALGAVVGGNVIDRLLLQSWRKA